MKTRFAQRLRQKSIILMLSCALPVALADPIPARNVQGTFHGFLELLSEDGHVVASGEATQTVHGGQITSRTLFKFKDGSIDDETTVYTQRRVLQLISDRHIQKGPYFPHPVDMLIETRTGQVTVRTVGKDGKEEVKTDHINMPPDLANGLVATALENLQPHAPETRLSMIVLTPKPRLVKLAISETGEDSNSVAGAPRKAVRYEIKIELGGIVGVIAPIVGKAPPTIQIWSSGGENPAFLREQGPLYSEGPTMTIQLASPVWPETHK